MPLDRLVLLLVTVLCAAGATVWLVAWATASAHLPIGWALIVPIMLVGYVLWRVVADRLADRRDDPYDGMDP
ncbi:hypothetical protein [Jannaschia sp. LMIT008]|uniref:hypothetical protein n=1 Tax=Jannaschia maritima TaxID=3032585 RepID=UPI00281177A3|nr:hypothetical protein [Jannaschia sp. LMIT008]